MLRSAGEDVPRATVTTVFAVVTVALMPPAGALWIRL